MKPYLAFLVIIFLLPGCSRNQDSSPDGNKPTEAQAFDQLVKEAMLAQEENLPEGVTLGEPVVMSGPEFLKMMQEAEKDQGDEKDEYFISVKIPGVLSPKDRENLFGKPIDQALGDLGSVTGGGTMFGKEPYSDIDISAVNLEEAIECIKTKLQQIKCPKGTQILYTDGDEDKTIEVMTR